MEIPKATELGFNALLNPRRTEDLHGLVNSLMTRCLPELPGVKPEVRLCEVNDDEASLVPAGSGSLSAIGRFGVVLELRENGWRFEQATTFLLTVIRAMADEHILKSAHVRRYGAPVFFVPNPPVVEYNHIVAFDWASLDERYAEPDALKKIPDAVTESIDGIGIVSRAMDAESQLDFLTAIREGQWHLVRAAKAGTVRYGQPDVPDWAETAYKHGPAQLHAVAYLEEQRRFELSCALDEGQHVQGWEIYSLREILGQKRLADGRPVDTVRITFLEQRDAVQERRPLLDAGAEVLYYDEQGELVSVKE